MIWLVVLLSLFRHCSKMKRTSVQICRVYQKTATCYLMSTKVLIDVRHFSKFFRVVISYVGYRFIMAILGNSTRISYFIECNRLILIPFHYKFTELSFNLKDDCDIKYFIYLLFRKDVILKYKMLLPENKKIQ